MLRRSLARTGWLLLFISLYFVCAGIVLIRYPGLQNDELYFGPPIFIRQTAFYSVHIGRTSVPLMVMSYTGALKTWIYDVIFHMWAPSRWSVRVPVLIACLATIWLTWLWTRAIAGGRAAIAAAALLATDAMFLLTGVFDWGPVALQHLLLMSGLVLVTLYLQSSRLWALALGFFLWGLGLWDKALMIWPLAGLAVAAACIYPRELGRKLRPVPAAIAVAALLAGSAPLLWYNFDRHGETATANAVLSTDSRAEKLAVLRGTFDGSRLFGYMVEDRAEDPTRPPRGTVERASFAVRRIAGIHRQNLFLLAFIASLGAMFWLRRSRRFRPMLFLLITCLVTWLQMFLTHNAGGATHHVILLWPFPVILVAMALAGIAERIGRAGRAVFASILIVLVAANMLNENEYLARFAIRGGIGGWTDAIYALSDSLNDGVWTGIIDWGVLDSLRVLHKGRMLLFTPTDEALNPHPTPADIHQFQIDLSTPGFLFVEHTPDKEMLPHINEDFRRRAADLGYAEHVERYVADSAGQPVFEIFRFEKLKQSAATGH